MKRSEMVDIMISYFKEAVVCGDIEDLRDTAFNCLKDMEKQGMLPPSVLASYEYKSLEGKMMSGTARVNKWEPEEK